MRNPEEPYLDPRLIEFAKFLGLPEKDYLFTVGDIEREEDRVMAVLAEKKKQLG